MEAAMVRKTHVISAALLVAGLVAPPLAIAPAEAAAAAAHIAWKLPAAASASDQLLSTSCGSQRVIRKR
jgi:hypothetical protein